MENPQACIPPVNCSSDVFKGCTSLGFAEVYPASYGKAQSRRSRNTTSIHIQGRTSGLKDLSKELINLTEPCIFAEIQTTLKMDLREGFCNSPTLTTHTHCIQFLEYAFSCISVAGCYKTWKLPGITFLLITLSPHSIEHQLSMYVCGQILSPRSGHNCAGYSCITLQVYS